MFEKITIVGVGLIGGSLGLEIKKRRLAKYVIGCGRSDQSLKIAVKRRMIDEKTLSLPYACQEADLIVLCAPIFTIMSQLKEIAQSAKRGTIVIDVGSTKKEIAEAAEKEFKNKGIVFIGCHPMAGSEKAGPQAATLGLFRAKKVFVTHKNISTDDVIKVVKFWKSMGAIPYRLTPYEHDQYLAATSHFPQMAAYLTTLAVAVRDSDVAKLNPFVGNGFKDTTRIAASPSDVWLDILFSNKKNILPYLKNLKVFTERLIMALDASNKKLIKRLFDRASEYRKKIT